MNENADWTCLFMADFVFYIFLGTSAFPFVLVFSPVLRLPPTLLVGFYTGQHSVRLRQFILHPGYSDMARRIWDVHDNYACSWFVHPG